MKKRIQINTDKSIYVIDPDEVLYFKCNETSTTICFTNHEVLSVPKGMEVLEKLFGNEAFIRPHQDYLVNRNSILRVEMADPFILVLSDETQIPIQGKTQKEILEFIKISK